MKECPVVKGEQTMSSERNIKTFLSVASAASMGTSLGRELRAFILDQMEARRRREQGLPELEKRIYLQTLGSGSMGATGLLATLLAMRAERRRPLRAFLIGLLLATLVGDHFDRCLPRPPRPPDERG
jgi:hypothetical protein